MIKSKVTVIIPVYNGENTIARTLDSLISQTYEDWSALVADDGSTDGTLGILMDYKRRYPKHIDVITHRNIGQAETRNEAIVMADSEYIMFVDADDYVDVDYIESYVLKAEEGDYDCVVGGFRRETCKGKIVKEFEPKNKWTLYSNMVPWARIIKRFFLIKNDIRFLGVSIGEDSYFNFCIFSRTEKIGLICNKGYVWNLNDDSISFSKHKGFTVTDEVVRLLDSIVDVTAADDEFMYAWFVRYVVWYLLFSGRKAGYEEYLHTDKLLFDWLNEHSIKIKFPVKGVTNGETLKIRFCVGAYLLIRRLGLVKVFARMYAS